jgi:hypothetical protein
MDNTNEQGWDRGWEEHKLRQLRERAKWSLPQKLRWLEEAQQLADAITKAAEKARTTKTSDGT